MTSSQSRRERRRACYERSKHGTLRRRRRSQLSRRAATRHTSPTRYKAAKHSDHLPGPPSRRTTAHRRATAPHDTATRSPSCTGKLLIDHSRHTNIRGRRPGLKVTPPPLRRVDRADNLAALATQDCHPIHASNIFAP
jgi:hypothetical protein